MEQQKFFPNDPNEFIKPSKEVQTLPLSLQGPKKSLTEAWLLCCLSKSCHPPRERLVVMVHATVIVGLLLTSHPRAFPKPFLLPETLNQPVENQHNKNYDLENKVILLVCPYPKGLIKGVPSSIHCGIVSNAGDPHGYHLQCEMKLANIYLPSHQAWLYCYQG